MGILLALQQLKMKISCATNALNLLLAAHTARQPLNVTSVMTASMCPTTRKNVLSPLIFASLILSNMPITVLISTASSVSRASSSTLNPWNVKNAILHVTAVQSTMYV